MLKELRTQHRNIIQMSFSGFSNNEICEKLGMSPSSVSQIIRSPLGQAYLNGLNDKAQSDTLDVRKKLISLNKGALGAIERILDPKQKAPHSVQLNAAKDVLDRNGYKPPDKINIDMTLSAKTDAEIDAEIAAMEESIARTAKQDPIKITHKIDESAINNNLASNKSIENLLMAPDVENKVQAVTNPVDSSINISDYDLSDDLDKSTWEDYDELDVSDEFETFDDEFEDSVEDFLDDVFAAEIDESLIKSIPVDTFKSN